MGHFVSENCAGIHPALLQAMADVNEGYAAAYGEGDVEAAVAEMFSNMFERSVAVALVGTGTAANAVAVAVYAPAQGVVLAHESTHCVESENDAVSMYSGAPLHTLAGEHGRIAPATLRDRLRRRGAAVAVLSLTQATDAGVVYGRDEIAELAREAHTAGLRVHMDGARLANALATTGCSPADMTWRQGVDVLSFGITKNGGSGVDAVVLFDDDPRARARLRFACRRGGHLFPKLRFPAAQVRAYLRNGLWLANARHANAMAQELAAAVQDATGLDPVHPVEINMVYFRFRDDLVAALLADGHHVDDWADGSSRIVASFQTRREDVRAFTADLRRHHRPAAG